MEKTTEYNIENHHLFIDFSTAYDSINRAGLYRAMYEFGFPYKLINLVKATMTNNRCCIKIQNEISEPLETNNGLRQGDSLACLLFNIALEKIVRDANIQTRGNIFYKSVQLLAFADDIDIVARSERDIIRTFRAIRTSAELMGLKINEEKTKYMVVGRNQEKIDTHIVIDEFKFERVHHFIYLGSLINTTGGNTEEIKRRIQLANKSYFGLQKYFKSKLLSRGTKCRIYRTLIKPTLMYASETWAMTENDIQSLYIFERKILRRIFGPVNDGNTWRIRNNRELYNLYQSPDIISSIKISRLRWAGHVKRMADSEIPKKILEYKVEGRRRVGRPRLRWEDCITRDIKKLGVRNWWTVAKDRDSWRRILKEAEARPGL